MRSGLLVLGLFSLATAVAWSQEPVRPDSVRDSAFALPPITINVTRGAADLNTAPLALTAVTRDLIGKARQDLTIDDVLAGIPGVYLSNRYNFSLDQRVSIRGFGSRSAFGLRGVKVLLDGVPQTLPDGQGQLSNVDFGLVQRVEVIRGSASSLYGNASGGVIALESERPGAERFRSVIRAEGGSFGLFRWSSRASFRSGGLGGTLSVSQFSLDGFRDHSTAEALQIQTSGEYLLSGSSTLAVRLAHSGAPRADNPGALTLAELETDPAMAAPNNVSRSAGKEVSQQQASITFRHQGAEHASTEISLFGLRRSLDNPLATNVFIILDRWAGGVRASTTRPLGPGPTAPRLTFGADLQRMRDDRINSVAAGGQPTDTTLLDQLETVTEIGPFLNMVWQPSRQFLLSSGVRYDRVSFKVDDRFLGDSVDNGGTRVMSAWSGHVGISFTGLDALVPYVNLATSFETPTTTELVNQPGGTGGFNDQLDPQRATNYEVGVRGRSGPRVEYSAAFFRARIEDALIPFSEVGGRAFFTNAGRLHNDGIELGLRIAPSTRWDISAAYTYAHYRFDNYRITSGATIDTLDGNQLAGVPEHYLRMLLRLSPVRQLRLELEQLVSGSLFADDRNTIEVEGWGAGVTTFRGSWNVRAGALDLLPFLGVNNLFDRSYVSSVTVNGFGGRVFEPGPRRNVYFGLEIGYSPRP
jgi:iron complex outermembrane receptor protein